MTMKVTIRCTACLIFLAATPAFAQQAPPDLTKVTLEDLMQIKISSADRKPEAILDATAAVYVITGEDIRRSGLTSVPEMLRLAPGVQVARIDSNKWAIAVRGFNSRWSNNLLVMVDGRSVYDRLESGVYWDMVAVPADNIERIEVVRGPGGSLWGANAVDGVINIVTKTAQQAQGGLVTAGVGDRNAADVSTRYGDTIGRAAYRITGQWSDRGFGLDPVTGSAGGDDSHLARGGARIDWNGARDAVTLQGNLIAGVSGTRFALPGGPVAPVGGWPTTNWTTDLSDGYALARWKRTGAGGGSFQLQTSVDRLQRAGPDQNYRSTSVDGDVQYNPVIRGHQLVLGSGFRYTDDAMRGSYVSSLTPSHADLVDVSAFAQDEIRIARTPLSVTFGSKVEHETLGGWGVQPTARLLWAVSPRERVWFAASRVVRAPSRIDRGLTANIVSLIDPQAGPTVFAFEGNPDYQSEESHSVEAGYRAVRGRVSFDAAAYVSHHGRLRTLDAQPPQFLVDAAGQPYVRLVQRFGNGLEADTRGVETTVRWQPIPRWQIEGSVSAFHITPLLQAGAAIFGISETDPDTPAWQWQIRSSVGLGHAIELGGAVWSVGALQARQVPAYTRVDVHVQWTPVRQLSLGLLGQDLGSPAHLEFSGLDSIATPTLVSRSFHASVTWRF